MAFARLVEALDYNLRKGHMTVGGCPHEPPCKAPTDQQLEDLDRRVTEAIAARRKAEFDKKLPRGTYEKFVAPGVKQMEPHIKLKQYYE